MANTVIGELIEEAGMVPVKWRTIFPAGAYPLEVFEQNLPNEVIGAVLIATPDVSVKRRDISFSEPVTNVILEYGYLAARLGRRRVVICKYHEAKLPSDLEGLTVIEAGPYEKGRTSSLPDGARTQLRGWLDGLLNLPEEIPPVRQFHGYSGKWEVKSGFSRWRDRTVKKEEEEEVVFKGSTFLFIDVDGKRVSGMQKGLLSVRLIGGYKEDRSIFNEIVNGVIDRTGTLTIDVRVRSRELVRPVEGKPPHDLGEDRLMGQDEAVSFKIELAPVPRRSKYLKGAHCYEPGQDPHQLADEDWNYAGL
jgi:hypothetical protein